MKSFSELHDEFNALMEAEDETVRERVPGAHCSAHVRYSESGEAGCWVQDVPNESLGARFEIAASEGGIALGCPQGTSPKAYWLSRLSLDLRESGSEYLNIYSSTVGVIERLFEASAILCSRLEHRALESTVNPFAQYETPAPSSRPENPEFASTGGRLDAIAAYAQWWQCSEAALARRATMDPADLSRWKTGGLPDNSDKKRRIETALTNNEQPIPAVKKSTDL